MGGDAPSRQSNFNFMRNGEWIRNKVKMSRPIFRSIMIIYSFAANETKQYLRLLIVGRLSCVRDIRVGFKFVYTLASTLTPIVETALRALFGLTNQPMTSFFRLKQARVQPAFSAFSLNTSG